MTEQTLNVDIDSLLDGTLDDLADIPAFQPYPNGAHRVRVKFEFDKEKKTVIFFRMEGLATEELEIKTDTPIKAGDKAAVRMDLTNEFGQGNFKLLIGPFLEHFKCASNREAMAAADNCECLVVTKVRPDSKDKEKKYTEVTNLMIV